MDALTQRLQEAYMSVAESSSTDPILPRIHKLVRRAKEIKVVAA